jgi:hypothetical protein
MSNGKSIEQLRDQYISKKLEGINLPYGMEYLNLLSKIIDEADALYPMNNNTKIEKPKFQTSIEWLIAELGEYFPHEIGGIHLMVEKAKEMHKQEIVDAVDGFPIKSRNLEGEEYYNETFKQ